MGRMTACRITAGWSPRRVVLDDDGRDASGHRLNPLPLPNAERLTATPRTVDRLLDRLAATAGEVRQHLRAADRHLDRVERLLGSDSPKRLQILGDRAWKAMRQAAGAGP
jgi:hypothetical protein